MTLTRTQALLIETVLTESFDIGSLADIGVSIRRGVLDATIEEVFDVASLISCSPNGLNLTAHAGRTRIAVAMFHCIRMNSVSDDLVDEIVECGLLKALRAAANASRN